MIIVARVQIREHHGVATETAATVHVQTAAISTASQEPTRGPLTRRCNQVMVFAGVVGRGAGTAGTAAIPNGFIATLRGCVTKCDRHEFLDRHILHATDTPNGTAGIPIAIPDHGGASTYAASAPAAAATTAIFLLFAYHVRAPVQIGQQFGGLQQLRGSAIETGTRTGTAAAGLTETLLRLGQQRRARRDANRRARLLLLRKLVAASGVDTITVLVVWIVVVVWVVLLLLLLCRHLWPRACCEELTAAGFTGQVLVGSTNDLLLLRSRRMDKVGAIAIDHLGWIFVAICGGSCCRGGQRCRNVGGGDVFLQMAQPVA